MEKQQNQKVSKKPGIVTRTPKNNKMNSKIPLDISVLIPKKKVLNISTPQNKIHPKKIKQKFNIQKRKENPWNKPITSKSLKERKYEIILTKIDTHFKDLKRIITLRLNEVENKLVKVQRNFTKTVRNINRLHNLLKTYIQATQNNGTGNNNQKIYFIDKGNIIINVIFNKNGVENIRENTEKVLIDDNNLYINKTIVVDKMDESNKNTCEEEVIENGVSHENHMKSNMESESNEEDVKSQK